MDKHYYKTANSKVKRISDTQINIDFQKIDLDFIKRHTDKRIQYNIQLKQSQ